MFADSTVNVCKVARPISHARRLPRPSHNDGSYENPMTTTTTIEFLRKMDRECVCFPDTCRVMHPRTICIKILSWWKMLLSDTKPSYDNDILISITRYLRHYRWNFMKILKVKFNDGLSNVHSKCHNYFSRLYLNGDISQIFQYIFNTIDMHYRRHNVLAHAHKWRRF